MTVAIDPVKAKRKAHKRPHILYVGGSSVVMKVDGVALTLQAGVWGWEKVGIDVDALTSSDTIERMLTYKPGDTLVLKVALRGHDNSYSSPSRIELPVGTELSSSSVQGTNRGNYFFNSVFGKVDVCDFYSMDPYALPIFERHLVDVISCQGVTDV